MSFTDTIRCAWHDPAYLLSNMDDVHPAVAGVIIVAIGYPLAVVVMIAPGWS